MLTDALRAIVNNLFKESFYGKIKKVINILIIFFIFHKSGVKTFLKLIVNYCPKGEIIIFTWRTSDVIHLSTKKLPHV